MWVATSEPSYAERVLQVIVGALSDPESLVEQNILYVDGWVERRPDGDAIRVIYDRDGADRRFGRRVIAAPDVYGQDPTSQGWAVAEDIDEPLGRHWDLLVEEQGVWWWGDGYPTLDEHPEMPRVREYLDALTEHLAHGGPAPMPPTSQTTSYSQA